MADFEKAVNLVLNKEGGYVFDPLDPGGETKFGISKRSYPNVDIKNLTIPEAKEFYRRDFWDHIKGDLIKDQTVADHILDVTVHHGINKGIELAQKSAGAIPDGIIGPDSLSKINALNPDTFNKRLVEKRLAYMIDIIKNRPTSAKYWFNWSNRAKSFLPESTDSYFLIIGILAYLLYTTIKKGKK